MNPLVAFKAIHFLYYLKVYHFNIQHRKQLQRHTSRAVVRRFTFNTLILVMTSANVLKISTLQRTAY